MRVLADRVVLYERDGCHLCEQVRLWLDESLGVDGYRRLDIDQSDELVLRYGFRIPVVALDGVDLLEAPISPGELQRFVERLPHRSADQRT